MVLCVYLELLYVVLLLTNIDLRFRATAGRERGRGRSQRVGEKHVDGEVKIAREFYNERWRDAGGLGDTG